MSIRKNTPNNDNTGDAEEDDFSYEEFVADEFGEQDKAHRRHIHPLWWLTALLLLLLSGYRLLQTFWPLF